MPPNRKKMNTSVRLPACTVCSLVKTASILRTDFKIEQTCIPVGCVLPAAVAVGGGRTPGQFPLNFPLGCGPGPDPPPPPTQLPLWLWAWRPPWDQAPPPPTVDTILDTHF